MIRLLLAEDQGMMRSALAALLALEDDLEVVGQVSTARRSCPPSGTVGPTSRCSTSSSRTGTPLDVAATVRAVAPTAPSCSSPRSGGPGT